MFTDLENWQIRPWEYTGEKFKEDMALMRYCKSLKTFYANRDGTSLAERVRNKRHGSR